MQLRTVLPSALADWITGSAQTATEERRLTRLARYILGKYKNHGIPFNEEIEISREHFRAQIGTHYLGDLAKLKAAKVIVSNEQYTPGLRSESGERLTLGQCKKYRFAPEFVFSDPAIVSYNETARSRFDMTDPAIRLTLPILTRLTLTLSTTQLRRYVRDMVTLDYIRERCKINSEIVPGYYLTNGDTKRIPRERDRLIVFARRINCDAILYRDKIYFAPSAEFIRQRMYQTQQTYLDALIRLKEIRKRPNAYCARNNTNRRLDTNLTNLKSDLLELIRLDGERLVSIDKKNSQFALLAHLIEQSFEAANALGIENKLEKIPMRAAAKLSFHSLIGERGSGISFPHKERIEEITLIINATKFQSKTAENGDITISLPDDLSEFLKLTKSGKFYEKFASILSADSGRDYTRSEAKRIMFLTLFSAYTYNPPEKRLLSEHFPSLVTWTNEFKRVSIGYLMGDGIPPSLARKWGNAELAVTLQNIESDIFVDRILVKLLSAGYRVLSKHDSILCKESDLGAVCQIVSHELDNILGVGGYVIA